MKARVIFYCAAVVALVLFLAAVPSHATERRDPFVMQDTAPTQPAKPSVSAHVTPSHKKPAKSTQKPKAATASAGKTSSGSGQNASSVSDGTGSSSAAK